MKKKYCVEIEIEAKDLKECDESAKYLVDMSQSTVSSYGPIPLKVGTANSYKLITKSEKKLDSNEEKNSDTYISIALLFGGVVGYILKMFI